MPIPNFVALVSQAAEAEQQNAFSSLFYYLSNKLFSADELKVIEEYFSSCVKENPENSDSAYAILAYMYAMGLGGEKNGRKAFDYLSEGLKIKNNSHTTFMNGVFCLNDILHMSHGKEEEELDNNDRSEPDQSVENTNAPTPTETVNDQPAQIVLQIPNPNIASNESKQEKKAEELVTVEINLSNVEDNNESSVRISSKEQAIRYFSDAVNLGHFEAMFFLADLAAKGIGEPKNQANKPKAIELYKKLSVFTHASANFVLGNFAEEDKDSNNQSDYDAKAIEFYDKASNAGHPKAMIARANLAQAGKGERDGKPNYATATEFLKKAIDYNDSEAMLLRAKLAEEGKGEKNDKPNYATAIEFLKKASAWNNVEALFLLGKFAEEGKGEKDDKPNYAKAIEFYEKASNAGHPKATIARAKLAQAGKGESDRKQGYLKAVIFYEKANQLQCIDDQALCDWADCIYQSDSQKAGQAIAYYKTFITKLDSPQWHTAMSQLAYFARNGYGEPHGKPNYSDAMKYLQEIVSCDEKRIKASKKKYFGDLVALYCIYAEGQPHASIGPNCLEATKLYERIITIEPNAEFVLEKQAELYKIWQEDNIQSPNYPKAAFLFRRCALLRLKQGYSAEGFLNKLTVIGNKDPISNYHYLCVLYLLYKYKAIEEFKKLSVGNYLAILELIRQDELLSTTEKITFLKAVKFKKVDQKPNHDAEINKILARYYFLKMTDSKDSDLVWKYGLKALVNLENAVQIDSRSLNEDDQLTKEKVCLKMAEIALTEHGWPLSAIFYLLKIVDRSAGMRQLEHTVRNHFPQLSSFTISSKDNHRKLKLVMLWMFCQLNEWLENKDEVKRKFFHLYIDIKHLSMSSDSSLSKETGRNKFFLYQSLIAAIPSALITLKFDLAELEKMQQALNIMTSSCSSLKSRTSDVGVKAKEINVDSEIEKLKVDIDRLTKIKEENAFYQSEVEQFLLQEPAIQQALKINKEEKVTTYEAVILELYGQDKEKTMTEKEFYQQLQEFMQTLTHDSASHMELFNVVQKLQSILRDENVFTFGITKQCRQVIMEINKKAIANNSATSNKENLTALVNELNVIVKKPGVSPRTSGTFYSPIELAKEIEDLLIPYRHLVQEKFESKAVNSRVARFERTG